MTEKPIIYLIDDQDQTPDAHKLKALGVEAEYLYPTAVTPEHIARATLLAVDEYFDLRVQTQNEDWDLPPGLPPAVVPEDGLALASVLRSAGAVPGIREQPMGIAIRTSDLAKLARGVPRAVRQPLVAAQYDLEWAVAKQNEDGADSNAQLVSLALALQAFPKDWSTQGPLATGLSWISVPAKAPWAENARLHISACRPPANTTTTTRHNLAWLRWLAHRALPFPTFVLSDIYAATELGITVESFRAAAADSASEFGRAVADISYKGPLADLQLPRYWRAGVQHIAAAVVDDPLDADEPMAVALQLVQRHPELEPLGLDRPVVTIDDSYYPSDDPIERTEAKRLAPDEWPAYADPAWVSKSDAEDPAMHRLLAPRLR